MDCSCEIFGIALSILLSLCGLALMIFGILVLADVTLISDKIMPLLNHVTFSGGMNLGATIYSFTIMMIIIGLIIAVSGGLGVCSPCCDKTCLRVACIVIVIIGILVDTVALVLSVLVGNNVGTSIVLQLNKQFKNYKYDDLTSHEISTAWNHMFMDMSCCGLLGTTNEFNRTDWKISGAIKEIPTGCCTGATVSNYATYNDSACTDTMTSGYNTKGCFKAIADILQRYKGIFIGVEVILIVIEVVNIFLSRGD